MTAKPKPVTYWVSAAKTTFDGLNGHWTGGVVFDFQPTSEDVAAAERELKDKHACRAFSILALSPIATKEDPS